jgi:choline transport protein
MMDVKGDQPGVRSGKSAFDIDDAVFQAQDERDNHNDVDDMARLGKAQEFNRNFSYISTLGFISVYMATWEITILVLSAGLYAGGFAGICWSFFATCIAYAPVVLSLAEMESMVRADKSPTLDNGLTIVNRHPQVVASTM